MDASFFNRNEYFIVLCWKISGLTWFWSHSYKSIVDKKFITVVTGVTRCSGKTNKLRYNKFLLNRLNWHMSQRLFKRRLVSEITMV